MSTPWTIAFAALSVLVLALGVIVLGVVRLALPQIEQSQTLIKGVASRLRRFGLPAGMAVPAFTAETVGGDVFTERDLLGQPTAILFLGSSCPACSRLFKDLAAGDAPDLRGKLVVIAEEDDARQLAPAIEAGVIVLIQRRASLATVFESDRIPHVFVLDREAAVVRTGSASTWRDVAELAGSAAEGGDRTNIGIPIAASQQ